MKLAAAALMATFTLVSLRAGELKVPQGGETNQQEKKLIERVSPYLVQVQSESPRQHKRYIVTGLAIGRDRVLTSALIRRNGDERIKVLTVDGRSFTTELQGSDEVSSLALLRVKDGSLDYARDTARLSVGDRVWVIGTFYQKFPSLLQGVVTIADDQQIIINAPAIPGVSGGAVISEDGALAGIVRGRVDIAWNRDLRIRNEGTELVFQGGQRAEQPLLFALPIENAKRIAEDLSEFGYRRKGWIGAWCSYLNDERRLQVTEVTAASPAEKAGIKPGDKIDSVDGRMVQSVMDLQRAIFEKRPGDQVVMKVFRNGRLRESKIQVDEDPMMKQFALNRSLPVPPSVASRPEPVRQLMPPPGETFRLMRFRTAPNLGLVGTLLSRELAEKRGVKEGYGIVLREVMPESPLRALNFQMGDIVVEVDGRPIRSYEDLQELAEAMDTVRFDQKRERKTLVRYYRSGKPQSSAIQLQTEPLRADELRQLRNRMDQMSMMLRDHEFQLLAETLRRLKETIKGHRDADAAMELEQMNLRIEEYRKRSMQRIEEDYEYLKETLTQLKKEIDRN